MPVGIKIDIKLDIDGFAKDFTELVTKKAATAGQRIAKRIVRKRSGDLKKSIILKKDEDDEWFYYSDSEYALAQEYGLEPFGKPRYGFTPYMRPSARRVIEQIGNIATNAANQALQDNKV